MFLLQRGFTVETTSGTCPNLKMISPQEMECRKICSERFFLAIACSTGLQFVMLGLFLIFINFNIFHPIAWIAGSISKVFSPYTWLCITPLIGSVVIYGMLMARHLVSEPKYYRNRFTMYRSSGRKLMYLGVHGIVGFLTAWLYAKYLPEDYSALTRPCDGQSCYNDKYIFIIVSGFYTGIYFFLKEHMKSQNLIVFSVILQGKYQQVTTNLGGIFCKSLSMTFFSALLYVLGYWLSNGLFKWSLEAAFGLKFADDSIFVHLMDFLLDWRLIIYEWILSSQILSNMYLINRLLIVFLTEYRAFPVNRPLGSNPEYQEITLAEALATQKLPVIQDLACQDLFMIANGCDSARRKDIFMLSIPGGHPHTWKALVSQCLELVNGFNEKLVKSIEGMKLEPVLPSKAAVFRPTATEVADHILWMQHNEGLRIQRHTNPQENPPASETTNKTFYTIQDFWKFVKNFVEKGKKYLMNYPGIHYLFSETPFEETFFHLMHSQRIIWIVQAISTLAEKSVPEDTFGVVQNDLTDIIRAFIHLKNTLDKIGNIMLGERRVDRNFLTLKSAVKRSLYRISNTFSDYFSDLRLSDPDLKHINLFATYKEA